MLPHDGLVPVMKKICKWYEFSGLFSHLSNNITSFRTLISRWGKYSWIFSFSQLRTGPFEESGAPRRGKIQLSVKLWKCLSHCSSIRNKITTFQYWILKPCVMLNDVPSGDNPCWQRSGRGGQSSCITNLISRIENVSIMNSMTSIPERVEF